MIIVDWLVRFITAFYLIWLFKTMIHDRILLGKQNMTANKVKELEKSRILLEESLASDPVLKELITEFPEVPENHFFVETNSGSELWETIELPHLNASIKGGFSKEKREAVYRANYLLDLKAEDIEKHVENALKGETAIVPKEHWNKIVNPEFKFKDLDLRGIKLNEVQEKFLIYLFSLQYLWLDEALIEMGVKKDLISQTFETIGIKVKEERESLFVGNNEFSEEVTGKLFAVQILVKEILLADYSALNVNDVVSLEDEFIDLVIDHIEEWAVIYDNDPNDFSEGALEGFSYLIERVDFYV